MPLQFFSEQGSGTDLPFVKDFLLANKKEEGKSFKVTEIIAVSSGKGYLVKTDYFLCWLWRKTHLTRQLIEALSVYCSQNHGYSLYAVPTSKAKDGFTLAVDTDYTEIWYETGNGSYSVTAPSNGTCVGVNPFLPASIVPSPNQEEREAGGRKKMRAS